jgi:hypothetical protein
MKTILASTVAAALVMGSLTVCLASQDYVGIVKAVAGDVVIVRNDKTIKAQTNTKLLEGDVVRTGPGGKAGLLFEDDTVMSMGSNTNIVIVPPGRKEDVVHYQNRSRNGLLLIRPVG